MKSIHSTTMQTLWLTMLASLLLFGCAAPAAGVVAEPSSPSAVAGAEESVPPMPSPSSAASPSPAPAAGAAPSTRVNQLGYLPRAAKLATIVNDATEPLPWSLRDASGTTVAEGQTTVHGDDRASGEHLHIADFSAFTTPGTGYSIMVENDSSHRFAIDAELYRRLRTDALRYFYHNRSGIAIEMPFAGEPQWARPAGHLGQAPNTGDTEVPCAPNTGCDYTLDVRGGWYDAGDHGKYVVNGGISLWTMLNQYERAVHLSDSAAQYTDGALNIPESDNGVPDILDEARWEMEFFLRMQVPQGQPLAGMAHHKIHDAEWTGLPMKPDQDPKQRYLRPPSTAATLNLAATAAQCARIWQTIDTTFSATCRDAAARAWQAAKANPNMLAPAGDNMGGGPYDDNNVTDEFFWAAAELFVTTGEQQYHDALTASPYWEAGANGQPTGMYWGATGMLGAISLAVVPNELSEEQRDTMRGRVIAAADRWAEDVEQAGYRLPFAPGAGGYPWGSNSSVLNNMIMLALAFDFTSEPRYLDAALEGMNYLLGRNPMDQAYITGYGARPLQNPHHRFWARQIDPDYPPPPPGAVSGGPNSGLEDPYAQSIGLAGCAPQKCFVDHIESWSTNEITVNWNAPLAWMAAFLDEQADRYSVISP